MLIDKAQLLTLTAPEMTTLLEVCVFLIQTLDRPITEFSLKIEALTNDFFVNLLELDTTWKAVSEADDLFEGRNRATGELKWTGSRVDLIFGSNTELRAIAEVYASADSQEKFVHNFVAVWNKVMNLGFDLA
jgi:catalase-peroxidase